MGVMQMEMAREDFVVGIFYSLYLVTRMWR